MSDEIIPGKFYRISMKEDFSHKDDKIYLKFSPKPPDENGNFDYYNYSKKLLKDSNSSLVVFCCKEPHDKSIKFFYKDSYFYDEVEDFYSAYDFEEV